MNKNLLAGIVGALSIAFATNASAVVYTYTFGERIDTAGPSDFGPATPGSFATLVFDDIAKTFTLSFLNAAPFLSGARIDTVAVNYNDGNSGTTPSATPASAISGGVTVVSANNSNGPYGGGSNNDPFSWAIGNGSNYLNGGESVSWTAAALNTSWLASDSNGTFALHVYRNGSGADTNSWYKATSVVAVPEPETYAMLLAGLGLVGFMARRRTGK